MSSQIATPADTRLVYRLDEGHKDLKPLLGSKGANLCEMARLGLPVPPAFIITTAACRSWMHDGPALLQELITPLAEGLQWLEAETGRQLGDAADPLLVSVRSGAAVSMPGMMETILNLGLNDSTVVGLAAKTNNERFAFDCYRRFLQMFGEVVLEIDGKRFDLALLSAKRAQGVLSDQDLSAATLQEVCIAFKTIIAEATGAPFPENPQEQLQQAIIAVFRSWNGARAKSYRAHEGIPDDLGTAVNIQAMVFGNRGDRSGSGVAFSRNPSTGERELYGEFLINAQGEDVVAGIRTPQPVSRMAAVLPEAHASLLSAATTLEQHYHDVQDIEFTIEESRFYLLQTRTGKRTAQAALRIVTDFVTEGLLDIPAALLRLDPASLDALLHPALDETVPYEAMATGLPASPGAAVGAIVFSSEEAAAQVARDPSARLILVREETKPDDIDGMIAAQGILTSQGGMTSHAAVVARGMGKPCVAGCDEIHIDETQGRMTVGDLEFRAGDVITINGSTGEVIAGAIPTRPVTLSPELQQVLTWADAHRTLQVRTNADNATDARRAVEFGCEGIGLCRTEHMFLGDRAEWVADLILLLTHPHPLDESQRAWKGELLARLKAAQRSDFIDLFRVLDGRPCNIRLIDPPLHEFLPEEEKIEKRLNALGPLSPETAEERRRLTLLLERRREFSEENPMLGFRGVRLGIIYPEITRMQAEAIFEAALTVQADGIAVVPEIMVPLVSHVEELRRIRAIVLEVAETLFTAAGRRVPFQVGTMIEVPRAALTAGDIAQEAEFFSFGTNDLTQTTYGISRDDAETKFLRFYVRDRLLPSNPFERIDEEGVGQLMRMALTAGRQTRPGLKVGICGEQGGESHSVSFCHNLGLNYVSCSPYRVPIARLAAAQAAIRAALTSDTSPT
ncbi:MAG: Pyruvate, phosphate dikinase [bacterium]|nr:Pyruvate, phosphate dikinase [bacterium]